MTLTPDTVVVGTVLATFILALAGFFGGTKFRRTVPPGARTLLAVAGAWPVSRSAPSRLVQMDLRQRKHTRR